MSKQGPLICSRCKQRFSVQDVLCFNYFVQNLLCFNCCEQLKTYPPASSCFGKQYDEDAVECKRFCPDRKVCPMFQSKDVYQARDLTEEARKKALRFLRTPKKLPPKRGSLPFKKASIIGRGFELCMKGCTLDALNELCAKEGADVKRLLRIYRHEIYQGHEWEWQERAGQLLIVYPRHG